MKTDFFSGEIYLLLYKCCNWLLVLLISYLSVYGRINKLKVELHYFIEFLKIYILRIDFKQNISYYLEIKVEYYFIKLEIACKVGFLFI